MYKLKWLIACLLVSFSSFSQISIQKNDSVVTLSEDQARRVVKDLVHYDFLKQSFNESNNRIAILLKKSSELTNLLYSKDAIISTQEDYIAVQEDIINAKKPITLDGHVGIQTFQASLMNPILYIQTTVDIGKFTLGARVFVQPENPGGYGFVFQYKIF